MKLKVKKKDIQQQKRQTWKQRSRCDLMTIYIYIYIFFPRESGFEIRTQNIWIQAKKKYAHDNIQYE